MAASSWAVTSPAYPGLSLRLVAFSLMSMPGSGLLKCSLQVIEQGHPIAEDPISVDWRSKEGLDEWIANSVADGWTFTNTVYASSMDRDKERERLRNKRHNDKCRAEGKCPRCGEPAIPGHQVCDPCRVKRNLKTKERRLYESAPAPASAA